MNIKERFELAIDDLYLSACNLATEVTKLGYPKSSVRISTAGISWDKYKKQVCFEFNEKFANTLSDEEFSFVVAHEAMHLAVCHIFLINDYVNKIKRKSNLSKEEKDKQISIFLNKSNIAADCVVNDSLVNIYNLKKQLENIAMYGKKVVGVDCHNMSMSEVYQLLPEIEMYTFDIHSWDSFLDENGDIDKNFSDKIKGFIERNLNNSALSDKENQKLQDVANQFQHLNAGNSSLANRRPIVKISRNYINWNRLILEIVDSKKQEDIWSKPNRRLVSIYPDVILPKFESQEIETVFVAIDASGSIDQQQLSLFVDVVRNSPKRFKIEAVTFNTTCYPLNIMKEDPSGGGGTSFACIEKYIQKNLKEYPKCVVVISDGSGDCVNPQFPERWRWLLTDGGSDVYCKSMRHHFLRDFIK